MDDPSLLPFLKTNGNGHHYSMDIDEEIEHEEDELEDDDDLQDYEQNAPYPEDEIDEDEIEEDEIEDEEENQNEQEILIPPPPSSIQLQQTIQSERGGRRKGVPRRLQLSPQIIKPPVSQQRLLPSSIPKSMTNVHHHEQPILTSDQEDEIEEDLNNENHLDESFPQHSDHKQQNSYQLELLSEHMLANNEDLYDENNNDNSYNDEENIPEIVDDLLADIVTTIVRDVRHQRQNKFQQRITNGKTNGYSNHKSQTNGWRKSTQKHEQKITNGKHNTNGFSHTNSIKSSKSQLPQPLSSSSSTSTKLSDPSILFQEFTKMMHLNSQQQLVKQKQSSTSSNNSSFSSPPLAKRQKTADLSSLSQSTTPLSLQQQQQHQQLLWQMTQQLMMSGQHNDTDTSSLLKQQLLGLTPPGTVPKRVGRPPKQQTQPQVMRSSTNMVPPTPHPSTGNSPYERGSFAPRRRGRPPKYVTERGAIPGLSSHDLDASPYDQLFAAIENSVTGNSARTSSTAFQSALASMLGQQAGLSLPPPPSIIPPASSVVRNGGPASMVKQSAGQTRHSLPASSTATKLSQGDGSNGLDMPLMVAKKRGPGRPPKSQMPLDSHQVLQATKRMNSSLSNNTNNNFPPTMVPSSPTTSFNLNAAFVEMLQQQQLPR